MNKNITLRLWEAMCRLAANQRHSLESWNLLTISILFLKCAEDLDYKQNDEDQLFPIELPENSIWGSLVDNIGNPYLFEHLSDAFKELYEKNPNLNFPLDFQGMILRGQDGNRDLSKIIDICNQFDFKSSSDFRTLVDQLMAYLSDNNGKRGGDFTTPDSVSSLMVKLINPKGGSVLDSACGTGNIFSKVIDNTNESYDFYGQEINYILHSIARLKFAFETKSNFIFGDINDTLTDDSFKDLKTDYVIMHPPFNIKFDPSRVEFDPRFNFGIAPKGNANLLWIQHAVFHLNDTGKAAVLLSNSSLSSGGKEKDIRRNLLEEDLVESIITLPSQLMANTSIPVSVWILNKNKVHKGQVLFIDASKEVRVTNSRYPNQLSEESINRISTTFLNHQSLDTSYQNQIDFCKTISIDEIRENDYHLNPLRYINQQGLEDVNLSEALRFKDFLSAYPSVAVNSDLTYKRITVKDLSNNPDAYLLDFDSLNDSDSKPGFKLLKEDALLVSKVGTNLKPTFYKNEELAIGYASNVIFAFKVNQDIISIDYLITELHKDYISVQLNKFRQGSTIRSFNIKDFLNIKIQVPDQLSEQVKIVEREKAIRFQSISKELGFEQEIAKLKEAQTKDLGAKKHNIMQHLNNVKSSADVLIKMMSINNGVLKADEVIDPRRGVTVEKRFLRLRQSLDSVIHYVDNITNEIEYSPAEIINPYKLLRDCKEKGIEDELFSVEIIFDEETFENQVPLVKISTYDFEEIYNNILENARKHGFADHSKKYIFRITLAFIDEYVQISFENNGKPFPKGMSKRYNIKGEKAGASGGTGIGLWKVSQIAKHFGAAIEVIDEPNQEFPVGFKFNFNLETL